MREEREGLGYPRLLVVEGKGEVGSLPFLEGNTDRSFNTVVVKDEKD